MTLENKYNRGTHGDSSHMLSTVVLSNENQTCRGWEAPHLYRDATEKVVSLVSQGVKYMPKCSLIIKYC